MKRTLILAMATAVATSGFAITLNEGFDGLTGLPAGWSSLNVAVGGPGTNPNWAQTDGVPVAWTPAGGAGYVFANYNSSTGSNGCKNYLISPIDTINAGDKINFQARAFDGGFPDRLRLMLSPTGGTNAADFTVTCLTINPNLANGVFVNAWTAYSYTFTAGDLGGASANARVAFFHDTDTGGPGGSQGDYVGVDSVTSTPVPEPATMTALALGIGALAARRRRK